MLLIYKTMPNGHFEGKINISSEQLTEILKILGNVEFKCNNGFNQFVLKEESLTIGYNHYLKIKKYIGEKI